MAGIFADKGITGTSVKKREDFMRMIRHCRQRKIDVVLTKSVSRFARNTVDCLYYTRALKELGIAVIFEKENINSLEEDSELRITLSGAFAQSESESISANVTWGKRRAMESGKATIQYKYLYGYRRARTISRRSSRRRQRSSAGSTSDTSPEPAHGCCGTSCMSRA